MRDFFERVLLVLTVVPLMLAMAAAMYFLGDEYPFGDQQ